MATIDNTRYLVRPFSRQIEGDEAVIGIAETGTFAIVPIEALTILDKLQEGASVGEAAAALPGDPRKSDDLSELIEGLLLRGFLYREGDHLNAPIKKRFFSFGISTSWAKRVFGPSGLTAFGTVIGLAVAACISNPALIPPVESLYLPDRIGALIPWLLLASILAVGFHELGHLVAARAEGVNARLGFGNRLWILVVEADLSGLWAIPRARRFLPLLAGPLIDLSSCSLILLLLAAHGRGWIPLGEAALAYLRAIAVGYFFALVWQTYFFLRTDFYYVFATAFRCKNLMADTALYLRALVARRFVFLGKRVSKSTLDAIPQRELGVVRIFSVFWIAGRLIAGYMALFVQLPLLVRYAAHFASRGASMSQTAIFGFSLVILTAGFTLWVLDLRRRWRSE